MFTKISEYITSLQEISFIVIAASAILFIILERLFPYRKNQKIIRDGFFNDFVMYTVVQSYVLGLVIFALLNYLKANTGFYNYSVLGNLPVWLQLVILIFIHDLYIYWFHRWMHNSVTLWRIHEAHHSPRDVDWLSGSRSHSIEILINQTIEFAPIILLGASPEVAVYKGMVSAIWGMFIHCNIDVRLRWLQYIINGPEMHRWHHSDDEGKEYKSNYATKLAFWDWMFGTAYYPDPDVKKPKNYGLSDTPEYPICYSNQILNSLKSKGQLFNPIIILSIVYYDLKEYLMQHIFAFRKFNNNTYVQ
jgi:sterol desaturase/sphingolipid hydroxylase (fatty acid hydroxylase superfamily)